MQLDRGPLVSTGRRRLVSEIRAETETQPMKISIPRPWLVLGLALAFGGSCLWSQDQALPGAEAAVSEEEANAAALELANSLDSGDGGDDGAAEQATEETPPEREPKPAPLAVSAQKPANSGQPGTPQPVNDDDFSALRASSPFTRSLNLSDSLILTGIAQIGEETIATVVDKSSKESYVVSSEANAQGWRMVEVEGDQNNLQNVTAKILVAGGEVVSVRFDKDQLKQGEARPAPGSGKGRGSGGRRMGGGPPSEIREKLGKLSEDQRRKLFDKLRQIREKTRN